MLDITQLLHPIKDKHVLHLSDPKTERLQPSDKILLSISTEDQSWVLSALTGFHPSAIFMTVLPAIKDADINNIIGQEGITTLLTTHERWPNLAQQLTTSNDLLKDLKIIVLRSHYESEKSFALLPNAMYTRLNDSLALDEKTFREIAEQGYENYAEQKPAPWGINKDKISRFFYTHVRVRVKIPDASTVKHRQIEIQHMIDDC